MANSRYDFHKEEEHYHNPRFNRGTYIIVRIDGHRFHNFTDKHNFHKPNDKRALDLMVDSAKHLMRTYKGHIPLAYGQSDEFSFLINSTSSLLSRRVYKITSLLPNVFATYFNSNWDRYFMDPSKGEIIKREYDALFDAKPKEYPNYKAVIDYFRWRQIDCHINNLYNTTLHALTGRYVRHELVPHPGVSITEFEQKKKAFLLDGAGEGTDYLIKKTPISEWMGDKSKALSAKQATDRLSQTVSADKHDIMFLDYKINYNNELEQFKKGTIVVDTQHESGVDAEPSSIRHFHRDITRSGDFWDEFRSIFEDFVTCPPTK